MPRPVVGIAQQELSRTIGRGCGEELGRRLNGARCSKSQALSAGKLSGHGLLLGGSTTNFLPVTLGTSTDLEQPP